MKNYGHANFQSETDEEHTKKLTSKEQRVRPD